MAMPVNSLKLATGVGGVAATLQDEFGLSTEKAKLAGPPWFAEKHVALLLKADVIVCVIVGCMISKFFDVPLYSNIESAATVGVTGHGPATNSLSQMLKPVPLVEIPLLEAARSNLPVV